MKQQINQNLKSIKKQIDKVKAPNQKVKLVAVTKTRYPEEISAAISGGVVFVTATSLTFWLGAFT